MKKAVFALALALAVLIGGCGREAEREPDQGGLRLWFAAALDEMPVTAAALRDCPYTGQEETVPALMEALLAGPEADSGLTAVIPAGTELVDWSVEDRVAQIELSEPYSTLTGIDLTLADYCVALTLSQLNGVDGVQITVSPGQRVSPVRYPGDVLFSGAEEEPVEVSARLYFRRGVSSELDFEQRTFRLTESEQPALAVLAALIRGPEEEGLTPLLPDGVEIYSTRTVGGVCYADFSQALLDGMPAGETAQELIVSSIVETLCSLDAVEQVQLLVEGQTIYRYGQVELSDFLSPSGGG